MLSYNQDKKGIFSKWKIKEKKLKQIHFFFQNILPKMLGVFLKKKMAKKSVMKN